MKNEFIYKALNGIYRTGIPFTLVLKVNDSTHTYDHVNAMKLATALGWTSASNVRSIHAFTDISKKDVVTLVGEDVAESPELLFEIRGNTAARVYVPNQTAHKFLPILGNVDLALLRKQKLALVRMAESDTITKAQRKTLNGILGLIDAIQDNLVDDGYLTEKEVFDPK